MSGQIKVKIFDNYKGGTAPAVPSITIPYNGAMRLNNLAIELIGLKSDSGIRLLRFEGDNKITWMLQEHKAGSKLLVRTAGNQSYFSNAKARDQILADFPLDDRQRSWKFELSEQTQSIRTSTGEVFTGYIIKTNTDKNQ